MTPTCSYCHGPLTGRGHAGRPWPGRPAAVYCCFGCLSLGEQQQQEATSSSSSGWKLDGLGVRLGVSLLVVGQSMVFGLALNLHDDVPPSVRWFTQTLILCGTLLVVGLLGGPLLRAAWHELRRGRLTLEALFVLTMSGAMAASVQAHLTGRGKIYFEVVSVLLVVYTLGKVIGARSRAAALAGSRAWANQLATARLIDEKGRTRTVPVTDVRPGDVVEVHPGETIAVDGVIRDGAGFVSEAPVSGEPFAVVRGQGDKVLAGAASFDATLRIEATAGGTGRQVDRLLAAVEAARDRPLSLQSHADRLGRVFFPLVVLTAAGTFAHWARAAGWEEGLFNAMSVLLVACPCAIGLATPIVIWAALGRLAERGLVVRSGDAVERLAAVDRVLFDKTGTLTEDRFALVDVVTAPGFDRRTVLGWLSLVESQSDHPVAKPFARLPRSFPPGEEPHVVSLRVVPGCGLEAEIEVHTGARHSIRVGRPEWVAPDARALDPRVAGHRIATSVGGELAVVAVVAERVRDSVPEMLAEFRRLGLPVEVLTGDTAERAAALDLPPVRAGLLPDDKRAAVEAITAAGGRPLFVGDGINDASALAAAHVGVALAGGTDLAVGASDVTLYAGDLRVLPWAVELSRAAVRSVRRNLCRALCYNLIGMTLAACGALHPVVAAILMVVSSLSLVVSSARVGVRPVHCSVTPDPTPSPPVAPGGLSALVPRLALALQGVVLLLLLEPLREPPVAVAVLGGFALAGAALPYLFRRPLPHALDMCLGMLTLGNLGMLLGWWADNHLAPLACPHCCSCADPLARPWMWVGMLAFANAAMLRPGRHRLAMLTGGNLGMLLGMFAGGRLAPEVGTDSLLLAAISTFVGMTVGMVVGMLLGTWAVETLRGSAVLADEVERGQPEPDRDDRVADVLGR
jgi:heavy metal translocating P-type ATPase